MISSKSGLIPLTFALSMTITATQASTTAAIGLFSEFNAVTIGDYTPQGPDSEGRVFVGGTFNVGDAFPMNAFDPLEEVGLYANDFSFTGNGLVRMFNGGVVTPSSPDPSKFDLQSAGATLVTGAAGQTATDDLLQDLGIPSGGLNAAMLSASATWRDLPATATITNPGQNLQFNAGPGISVFNVSASDVFSQNYNPSFNLQPDTTAVLINVSGTSINNKTLGQNSFVNLSEQAKKTIIWNFYEATSVDLGKFGGAIMAPMAAADIEEPNGSVIALSLTHSQELHLDLYTGVDPAPTPIPEPSTVLSLAFASSFFTFCRRRKISNKEG